MKNLLFYFTLFLTLGAAQTGLASSEAKETKAKSQATVLTAAQKLLDEAQALQAEAKRKLQEANHLLNIAGQEAKRNEQEHKERKQQATDECPLCLGDGTDNDQLYTLQCGHRYHRACLRTQIDEFLKPGWAVLLGLRCARCVEEAHDSVKRAAVPFISQDDLVHIESDATKLALLDALKSSIKPHDIHYQNKGSMYYVSYGDPGVCFSSED